MDLAVIKARQVLRQHPRDKKRSAYVMLAGLNQSEPETPTYRAPLTTQLRKRFDDAIQGIGHDLFVLSKANPEVSCAPFTRLISWIDDDPCPPLEVQGDFLV